MEAESVLPGGSLDELPRHALDSIPPCELREPPGGESRSAVVGAG